MADFWVLKNLGNAGHKFYVKVVCQRVGNIVVVSKGAVQVYLYSSMVPNLHFVGTLLQNPFRLLAFF